MAKGTALVRWDQELARRAQVAKGLEDSVAVGNFLSVRGGQLTYQGNPIEGNKLKVVVLAHVLENKYYASKFDPNTPSSPVCYAFGTNDKDMRPHEKAEDKQSEKCATCEHNEWGSSSRGRGKSCKNSRRLALLHADSLKKPSEITEGTVVYLELPVTSVKGWAGYVQGLANVKKRPPASVITEISVVPDPKTQFKVGFKLVEDINDNATLAPIMKRADEEEKKIGFAYPPSNPDGEPKGKAKAKSAGKKTQRGVSRF